MNYKTLRYSAIVAFILLIALIFYSSYTLEKLARQGDSLSKQSDEVYKNIRILERNEQPITIEAYDEMVSLPLSAEQKLELKKLRNQRVVIERLDKKKRDAISEQIFGLNKKIRTLELNRQMVTIEASIGSVFPPLSTEQQLELKQLHNQQNEISQSLKDIGWWNPDKKRKISLSRFSEPAMLIILPYAIFLIPLLLSLFWKRLLHMKNFMYGCIAACTSSLSIYLYLVLVPVKTSSLGFGYIVYFMIIALTFFLGISILGITYMVSKRSRTSIT